MLIGAHVSTGGGLVQGDRARPRSGAASRSRSSTRARGCGARPATRMRTSPPSGRRWSPRKVEVVAIHVIYLINPAAKDREMRKKSLDSLTHALRVGDGIGALGVVVHPGALKDDTRTNARKRAINLIKEALARSESCPILYENTAGSPQLLGPRLRRDSRADREDGRPEAPRALHRLMSPVRDRLRHRFARGDEEDGRRDRRQGRPEAAQAHAHERRARPPRLEPRSPCADRQGRDRPQGLARLPRRASPAGSCPPCWRAPAIDGQDVARKDVQLIRRLWREAIQKR